MPEKMALVHTTPRCGPQPHALSPLHTYSALNFRVFRRKACVRNTQDGSNSSGFQGSSCFSAIETQSCATGPFLASLQSPYPANQNHGLCDTLHASTIPHAAASYLISILHSQQRSSPLALPCSHCNSRCLHTHTPPPHVLCHGATMLMMRRCPSAPITPPTPLHLTHVMAQPPHLRSNHPHPLLAFGPSSSSSLLYGRPNASTASSSS